MVTAPRPSTAAVPVTDDAAFRAALSTDILDAVGRAVASFSKPLCARCVGRFASRLERGLPNTAKGKVVAENLGLVLATDDAACPLCEGLFAERDGLSTMVAEAVRPYEFNSFLLGTKVHPAVLALEARAIEAAGSALADVAEPMKTELNREVGAVLAPLLGKTVDFQSPDLVATMDPYFGNVVVTTSAVYLYGRYRKFDRTIPQTKWPCNVCRGAGCSKCEGTGQQYLTSVEGLVAAAALPAYGAKDNAFHGSGREDIDALMLGTGRPFVLEFKEPMVRIPRGVKGGCTATPETVPLTLPELQARINAFARPRVEIEELRPSSHAEVVAIKEAAFDKAYRAHIESERPIARADLEAAIATIVSTPIEQRTPERVMHRRADKVRPKQVRSIVVVTWGRHVRAPFEAKGEVSADVAGPSDRFTLDILAESGTYIKELVNGDEGRTQPSFTGLLGVPMRVAALDVVGVGST